MGTIPEEFKQQIYAACNVPELQNLEYHASEPLDTDKFWKNHVLRDFPNQKFRAWECHGTLWKKVYETCKQENERKVAVATKRIAQTAQLEQRMHQATKITNAPKRATNSPQRAGIRKPSFPGKSTATPAMQKIFRKLGSKPRR